MGKFPERLMQILESPDEVTRDALGWNSDGDGFWILSEEFAKKVITKYFQSTKFESFIRKLNRWGFKRVRSTGLPHGGHMYRHDKFHRGKPELLKQMRTFKEERHWKEQLIWQEPLSHDLQIADARSLPNNLLESHTPSSMFFADGALNRQQADQVQPTADVSTIPSLLPSLPSSFVMSSRPFVDRALNDQQQVNRLDNTAFLRELYRLDQEELQRLPSPAIMSSRPFVDRSLHGQQEYQIHARPTTNDIPPLRSFLPSLPSSPTMSPRPFVDRALHDQQQVNRLDNTEFLRELYPLDQEELRRPPSSAIMISRPFMDRALHDQQQANRLDNTAFVRGMRPSGQEELQCLPSSAIMRVFADHAFNDQRQEAVDRVNNNVVLRQLQWLGQEEQAILSAAELSTRSIRRSQEEHLLALLCRERQEVVPK
jgi:hypothetical protein